MSSRRSVGSPGTILVVDPDDALRRSVRKWLEARDFLVLDAADETDAERIARVFVGPIHVLLIELALPSAAGAALAARLRSIHAEARAIFTSVRSQADLVRRRDLDDGQRFLRKTFGEEQLVREVEAALTRSL